MAAERPFYIYCHTAPNGKRYIGQTCQNPEVRWSRGRGYRAQHFFGHAIAKYGWDSFDHQILAVVHSKKIADLYERHYIAKYDTFNEEHGYNLTEGGGGRVGYKMSVDERRKLGDRTRGKSPTEEQRRRISETLKEGFRTGRIKAPVQSQEYLEKLSRERTGAGNPMYGRHHTKEAARRIGDFHKGKKHDAEWKRKISEARLASDKINRRAVCQFSLDGHLIATFSSVKAAAEHVGHAATNICSCCKGKYEQAYGFVWRYQSQPETFPVPIGTALT